jgi:thioredoxin 1
MSVFNINSVENLNKIIEICATNNKTLVLKASAEWCGPCKLIQPKYEKLAQELIDEAIMASFDVDEQQDIAQQFDISAMPTFIIIKDSNIIKRITGGDLQSIKSAIQDK